MTTSPFLQYGPSSQRTPTVTPARVVVTVLVAIASVPAALLTLFLAAISYTGCFIGCSSDPDQVGGLALGFLAAGILTLGPVTAAWLFRSRGWLHTSGWVFGGAALVALALVTSAS
jgi:hypothetical protein